MDKAHTEHSEHHDCGCSEHHGHSEKHGHSHDEHGEHAHDNPFLIPFLAITAFAVVEFAGGIWTQSLALLSDAWHMLFDVLALGLAMWAAQHARNSQSASRLELRVSMVNAVSMLVVAVWIIIEAIERFRNPLPVAGGYVSIIAVLGLLVNIYVARHMHHQHQHHGGDASLNHRAAFLHVLGDLLGSVTAIVAGVVIYFTGWVTIDPLLSIVISLLLLAVTLNLIRDIRRGSISHTH
ncbi:cation diffusion facilitator family transporter [Methylophilus luteus]|uniref:Cation diffusion facilitator family transporter n=1 Tax=Methylophilus luteus TaxID=640108 RepID=A0ABW3F658_9PROT